MAMKKTSRSTGVAGIAGLVVMVVMWLGGYYQPELFAELPPGAEATFTGGIMTIFSYWNEPGAPGGVA